MRMMSVVGILLLVACSTVLAGIAITIKTPVEFDHRSHSDAGAKRISVLNDGADIASYNMEIDDVVQIVKDPSLPSPEIKVCNGNTSGQLRGELYNCPGGGCDCSKSERVQVVEYELNPGECVNSGTRQCSEVE